MQYYVNLGLLQRYPIAHTDYEGGKFSSNYSDICSSGHISDLTEQSIVWRTVCINSLRPSDAYMRK